jgi:hypothetical protein
MSKFFSYPGSRAPQPEGNGQKLRLPDIYAEEHDAQLGEFLRSRENSTSHLEVGLTPGEKVWFTDAAGERRPAVVDHEERDQHSGTVSVHLHANDQAGSGSYRMDFAPDDARSLKAKKTIRTHE